MLFMYTHISRYQIPDAERFELFRPMTESTTYIHAHTHTFTHP